MTCNIYIPNIVFDICKINRENEEHFIFVGIVPDTVQYVLEKIEKRQNLDKDNIKILKKYYKDYYLKWVSIVKDRIKIKFIFDQIRVDDSLYEIKQKIFIYLSSFNNITKKDDWLLPNNQELWYINDNNKPILIGYKYENTLPHIYNTNFSFIDDNKVLLTSDNYICLHDLINVETTNVLYVSNIYDEINYIKKIGKNIDDNNIKKYLAYYWPVYNIKKFDKNISKTYDIIKYNIDFENYIFDKMNNTIFNNTKINFGSCNIMTIQLSVKNPHFNNNIDLYKIFEYIKDNLIDVNTPFLKYKDNTIDTPFTIISKEAILNKTIDINMAKDWSGLKTEIGDSLREFNKLQLKRLIDNFNNINKYSTVEIDNNGELKLMISYTSDYNANFNDIKKVIDNSKLLLNNINNINYSLNHSKNNHTKLFEPNVELIDNKVLFNEHTKIKFLNIIIPYTTTTDINFQELYKFSKYFSNFIVFSNFMSPEESIKEGSLTFRYKRVSGFVNLDKIMATIDILKESNIKDSVIINKLIKNFNKTETEVKSLLNTWKKKYSFFKNSRITTKYKLGLQVVITRQNIKINGITNLFQIVNTYKFCTLFLYLFLNKHLVNKKFISQEHNTNEINQYFINEIHNIKLNNNLAYKYNYHNKNIDFNIPNISYTNYNNTNQFINYIEKSLNKNLNKNYRLTTNTGRILASNEEIGTDIQLTCDDAIVEKDTCEDFCNDKNYFLRRLQRYDNKLFKFNLNRSNNKEQYSRDCQKQSQRQPVVLPYDPEKRTDIKKDSYTYSIKYSSDPNNYQNWYICPKIWCPYCEKPLSDDEIDKSTIRKRTTKGKGGICTTAQCPYGDHQVFVKNTTQLYPGFLDEDKHPLGYCLPCCFGKPHNIKKSSFYPKFSKCLGINVNIEKSKEDVIYILGKSIPIDKYRYGILPIEVSRILNTKIDTGYLEFKKGYVRKGINQVHNNNFLSAICDILTCNKNNQTLNVSKIKTLLTHKLDDKLFRSLYHGSLYIKFNDNVNEPIDNFKKYLQSDNNLIDHTYLWDYLQRPGVLHSNGLNIFIFEDNKLLCPIGEEIDEFYNKTLNSIILLKHRIYYEPIYYLEGNGKTADIKCIFEPNKIEIHNLFDIVNYWCVSKKEIRWDRVLLDNIKNYNLKLDTNSIENPLSLQKTIDKINMKILQKELTSDYSINKCLLDSYNKVFAILLNNNLFIPVKPTKINVNYDYLFVDDYSVLPLLPYKNVLKLLENINRVCEFNNIPIAKILTPNNDKVVALHTLSNRIIPIQLSPITNDNIKISNFNYYSDADFSIDKNIELIDNRILNINYQNYENETYNRIKYELSKYLKNNNSIKNKISDIINDSDIAIDNKRNLLKHILINVFNQLVSSKNNNIDIEFYTKVNKRKPCFKSDKLTCNSDVHCVYDDTCKVHIFENNLINNKNNKIYYLSMIIEELVRFKIKRDELINDEIPDIIDKNKITTNPNKYYVIHTYSINEINNLLDMYFAEKDSIFIDKRKLYEDTGSKYTGFDATQYLNFNITINNESLQEELSTYWLKLFTNKFNVQKNIEDSLFISIGYALKEIKGEQYDKNRIKMDISNFLSTHNHNKNFINKLHNSFKYTNQHDIKYYYIHNFKFIKSIITIEDLVKEINLNYYTGCEVDLYIMSYIYKINIIVLDKRLVKKSEGFKCYGYENNYENYIFLYKNVKLDKYTYDIVKLRDKFVFKLIDLNNKIITKIIQRCKIMNCNECKKKINIKNNLS